jgi:elongation factor Ts
VSGGEASDVSVPASLVKELRDQTGAGMMDVKRALEESGGDLEAARRLLRERGMAQAARRAGRETSQGAVLTTIAGEVGAMVAVGCETEPVSNNAEFLGFAERVLDAVFERGPEAVADLEGERTELIARLGENVEVRGATRMSAAEGETLAEYVHPTATNKIGVLVRVRGDNPGAARRLAMHISFAAPRFLTRDDVPESALAEERAVYEAMPDVQSKPEHVRGKIVEGMLQKRFFAESVLTEQVWIHDTSLTVGAALAQEGLEVVAFERFALAG